MRWFAKRGGNNSRKPTINPFDAYDGAFPDVLKTTESDPSGHDNTPISLVGELVDVSVNYEMGDGVKMDVQEGSETAQAFLDDFLDRSNFNVEVRKAAYHGALSGHRYLKLIVADNKPSRISVVPSDSVKIETL